MKKKQNKPKHEFMLDMKKGEITEVIRISKSSLEELVTSRNELLAACEEMLKNEHHDCEHDECITNPKPCPYGLVRAAITNAKWTQI